jgi:hypothetical protein
MIEDHIIVDKNEAERPALELHPNNSNMQHHTRKKFAWNQKIKAGGILFFDSVGIWVLKEKAGGLHSHSFYLSDPGGKYDYRDCSIINTISREFNEETFFAFNITSDLVDDHFDDAVAVCDESYLCVLAPLNKPFDLSKFNTSMNKTFKENKLVPREFYSTLDFFRLSYENIATNYNKMCPRLKQVIQKSFLKKYSPLFKKPTD